MKKLLLIACLIFICLIGKSQTITKKFFVEKTDGGYEQPVLDKLITSNYHITFKKDSADYIVMCVIGNTGMGRAKGSIAIIDNKTGNLIAKSKEMNGQTMAFNGYANPKMLAMKRIADKQLIDLINNLSVKN